MQPHICGATVPSTSPTHRRKRLQSASSAAAATPSPSACSAAARAGTASLRARQAHGRGEGGVEHAAASVVRGGCVQLAHDCRHCPFFQPRPTHEVTGAQLALLRP